MTTPQTADAPATGRDGLVDALVQCAYVTMATLNKIAAENDVSLTQMRVVAILRGRRLRMAVLADYLGLEKSTMTGLVDRAVGRGLLERGPSAGDRRAVEVFLSPAGTELAARGATLVRQALSPLTDELTGTEQRRLRELLERMLGPRGE